ncbi:hypothetical protein HZ326_28426 [Fusarium oxysporum f. sp. albedinis]|nr:hypothetical protein HZ326_28426 [Fusarium oxysporum f. sp. albedinis]
MCPAIASWSNTALFLSQTLPSPPSGTNLTLLTRLSNQGDKGRGPTIKDTLSNHYTIISVLNALADPSKAPTAIFANQLHITATPLYQVSLVIACARAMRRSIGGRVRPNFHIWYSSLRDRTASRYLERRVRLHSLMILSRLRACDDSIHMDTDQTQSSAPFPSDCLPPEGEFESREALFEAINAWAATRGYAFITGRSTKEKTGRRTITYMCDRRGNHPIASRER